jgi:hypothetical protein
LRRRSILLISACPIPEFCESSFWVQCSACRRSTRRLMSRYLVWRARNSPTARGPSAIASASMSSSRRSKSEAGVSPMQNYGSNAIMCHEGGLRTCLVFVELDSVCHRAGRYQSWRGPGAITQRRTLWEVSSCLALSTGGSERSRAGAVQRAGLAGVRYHRLEPPLVPLLGYSILPS